MEDDLGTARLVQKKLEEVGYEVDIACDGEEGLAMYRAGSYDVVLVDQVMPVRDGLGVIRILASQETCPPMIMITGRGNERIAVEAMKSGASDYIIKDVGGGFYDLLPDVIEQVLERKRLVDKNKQAEKALRESEARYRHLFEHMTSGVAIYEATDEGQDFIIKDMNRAGQKISRVIQTDIMGRRITEVFPGVKAFGLFDVLQQVWQTGEPTYHPIALYRDRRTSHWAENRVYQLPSGEIVAVYDDVSEKKRAEEALQKSEERFRDLYEKAPNAYFSIRAANGAIVGCNAAASRLLGYDRETMGRMTILDLHADTPSGLSKGGKIFARFKAGESIQDVEVQMKHKDGTLIWVSLSVDPVHDQGGHVVEGRSVVIDISARKKAADAIEAEKERLNVTLRSVGDGVIATDTKGHVVLMNPIAEALTGCTEKEAIGKPIEAVFHVVNEKTNQVCESPVRKVLEKGAIVGFANHSVLLSRDGTRRIIAESGAPIRDSQGEIIGVVLVFRDITDRVKMAEALVRNQKLESVGMLAGGIAHDFNNILTTIIGNIFLAKRALDPKDEIFELLEDAEKASSRAQALTQQLLTFSKGGAPVKKTASISQTIRDSCSFILRGSGSRCDFSIAEDLWPIEADVGQLNQVINNIVINANQAMPEGGIIEVGAENKVIEDRCDLPLVPGRYVKISIQDQGVGIAERHLMKIFDPYFTTKHKGSGLGLATAFSIINKHDGHITVASQLGVGTTFHIYLPASEKEALRPEMEKERPILGHGKILLMDDDEMLRKTAGRMLGLLGYEVTFAEDGAEAIEKYKAAKGSDRPYAAVILDLTVPGGMGGKEAIKRLLEIDPEVKAIVSSGYSDDPVLSNFRDYGFKGMAIKPYSPELLGQVLHDVLAGHGE